MYRKTSRLVSLAVACSLAASAGWAAPTFVNGIVIPGNTLDATGAPGANQGRLGFFSDLYYDPIRRHWWALSDRGPGGGLIDYETRVQKVHIKLDRRTGEIREFKVAKTIKFTDPHGLLQSTGDAALNGQNPLLLNGSVAELGRSFDPEGIVIDPRSGRLIVADEYGPSVYVFSRSGKLRKVFETPENLLPVRSDATLDYVSDRALLRGGRQDNRGFEGIAITPDGRKLVAVLQDPLVAEPGPNNGRDGRNVRIVVFDNDRKSATYGKATAQYAYQLELQSVIADRIRANGGAASPTDPRQGRNIGLSSIVAINNDEFLVLERDNRGIGVDDPAGATVTGTKSVFKIDLRGATDITAKTLPGGNLPADIIPVSKSPLFIDLAANSVLPNNKRAEKWEGLAIGPRLDNGDFVLIAGNDNDYSVTQSGSGVQFDVYADFAGGSVQRDLDQPTKLNGVDVGGVPAGYTLIPGVLHAYRATAADLPGYMAPGHDRDDNDHDDDDDDHDDRGDDSRDRH